MQTCRRRDSRWGWKGCFAGRRPARCRVRLRRSGTQVRRRRTGCNLPAASAASPGRVLLSATSRPGPLPFEEPWGKADIPSAPAATDGPPPRPRRRHRPRILGPAQRRGWRRGWRWRVPCRRRASRWGWRGCIAGRRGGLASASAAKGPAVSAGPAASPASPAASPASPGRGFLHSGFRPALFGETPLGPARSTRGLLPGMGRPSAVSSRNFWTVGSRIYGLPSSVRTALHSNFTIWGWRAGYSHDSSIASKNFVGKCTTTSTSTLDDAAADTLPEHANVITDALPSVVVWR